jgi:hypothetical protein
MTGWCVGWCTSFVIALPWLGIALCVIGVVVLINLLRGRGRPEDD